MISKYIKLLIRAAATPFFRLRRTVPPETEEIAVKVKDLPKVFYGYRLAVVSDLHLPDCLSSPAQVTAALKAIAPDCILLPGDLTNRYNRVDATAVTAFLRDITDIAPCYAITGNHEQLPARLHTYRALLEQANVTLIYDRFETLQKDGQGLSLYGACDPDTPLPTAVPPCAILLMHCPHTAVKAAKSGFALAVCGHAHGGQVRFGKHGLFAPGQGFFPQYISGLYTVGQLQMVISRGLGDSSLPIRLHNPPHLPVITLYQA